MVPYPIYFEHLKSQQEEQPKVIINNDEEIQETKMRTFSS